MAQQRYHVIERIDAGGMAEVFKANSTSLQGFEKLVAIKRILPDLTRNERFVRMFLDEAKISLHLNHTNCVQVFDLGLADGTYFIVMEYVNGTNLKNIIEFLKENGQRLPPEEVAHIGIEVCKGLFHAHRKVDQQNNHLGIVHRDISPPNVLISAEGEVKITDFGLAKAKSQVETTDPGVVKGKFGYLSPEAAHGESVGAQTDIYAVGILLWEMLTSERLFLGETDIDTLKLVRKNSVPALSGYRPDVPPALEKIIRRALETDLKQRYQTAEDLARELAEFLFSHGVPVTSFDIANQVRVFRGTAEPKRTSEKDKAVAEAIQDAVNRIVSLEEVDDLDLYLADTYSTEEDSGPHRADGNYEDPRDWGDFGFDDAPVSVREAPVQETGEAWEERGLDQIMRKRNTVPGGIPKRPQPGLGEESEVDRQQAIAEVAARQQAALQKQQIARVEQQQPLHQRSITPVPRDRSVEVAGGLAPEYVPAGMRQPAADTGEMLIPESLRGSKSSGVVMYIALGVVLLLVVAAGLYLLT